MEISYENSGIFKDGGKLIMYSGSADPCVPFPDAVNYYERTAERMGSYEKTKIRLNDNLFVCLDC